MIRLLTFLLFTFPLVISAQQITNYTQYTLNRFALNPAIAGINPCTEVATGFKRQWVGFEGAPIHTFGSFHTRLNKDDKYPGSFHGVGFLVSNDRNGFFNNTTLKIAYAYHVKLNRNYHASVGIYAGIQQAKFNYSAIRVRNLADDPVFVDAENKGYVYPEISPGGFIYNRNLYLGLSYFQAFPARINIMGTKENRYAGHAFFMGGYRLRGKTLHFIPSYLLSFSPLVTPTLDLTLTVDYKQQIMVALGSKYLNSGYATLQLRVSSSIDIGYTYEYALNEISNVAPTSHELILRFKSCSAKQVETKILCPAYQ